MVQIKRILVPTDLSKLSEASFDYAVSLAMQHKAKIYLVHVIEPAPAFASTALGITTETFEKRLLAEAGRALQKLAKKFGKKVTVETHVLKGNVADQLLAAAKTKRIGLIIMSTHGRSGIGHVLVGSIAEKIVRKAACPVLTVKPSR